MFVPRTGRNRPIPKFVKGQSGNPAGRPKEYRGFRAKALEHVDQKGVAALIRMAEGEGEDRRFALKLLIEYAYGKPQQYMDLTTGGQTLVKAYMNVDLDQACPPS